MLGFKQLSVKLGSQLNGVKIAKLRRQITWQLVCKEYAFTLTNTGTELGFFVLFRGKKSYGGALTYFVHIVLAARF